MSMKTTGPRVVIAVLLILIVSIVNGISGLGYVVGGEFETAMQAAVAEDDPRWQEKDTGEGSVRSPRDASAAISLLLETRYGRFGLALQLLCALQFIAGIILLVRNSVGGKLATFLILVGLAGMAVEGVGISFSSSIGRTNIIGIIVSVGLVGVTLMMHKAPTK